jgi:hypothetical protein
MQIPDEARGADAEFGKVGGNCNEEFEGDTGFERRGLRAIEGKD